MSRLDPTLLRVRRARPSDPSVESVEAAAVRIVARLAVADGAAGRDAEARGRQAVRGWRGAVAAAAMLLAVLFLHARSPFDRSEDVARAGPVGDEALATGSRAPSEPSARQRLLARAGRGDADGARALRDLATSGGVRDAAEAASVAALAHREGLREPALALLVRGLGTEGPGALRDLLEASDDADLRMDVVTAIHRVAAGGRTRVAVDAFVAGAVAGRIEGAVAALSVGRAAALDRLLDLAPDRVLESGAVSAAVADCAGTVVARLLRRAEEGDVRALRLAASSRLEACVPLLLVRALDDDVRAAKEAVRLLARIERPAAWLALARSLDGDAWAPARDALARLPEEGVVWLREHARTSPVDRPAALAGFRVASGLPSPDPRPAGSRDRPEPGREGPPVQVARSPRAAPGAPSNV